MASTAKQDDDFLIITDEGQDDSNDSELEFSFDFWEESEVLIIGIKKRSVGWANFFQATNGRCEYFAHLIFLQAKQPRCPTTSVKTSFAEW